MTWCFGLCACIVSFDVVLLVFKRMVSICLFRSGWVRYLPWYINRMGREEDWLWLFILGSRCRRTVVGNKTGGWVDWEEEFRVV